MDLFGGESSSSPGLQSSTSRLTLQDSGSSSPGGVSSASKRRREPSAANTSQAPGSPKRVKTHHFGSHDAHSQHQTRKPPSLASLQRATSPKVLLGWALELIKQARPRLPALSSPDQFQAALQQYQLDIRKAITCLRAIVDETQPMAKAEVTLEAIRSLIDLLLSDGDLSNQGAHQQVKDLLRRGLTAASTDLRYRRFKLAFQELQIQLWLKEGELSSLKLAKNEAKRIASEFPASTAEPGWAYHLLFLYHKLNTSTSSFDRLISFASQRGDQLVCDAVQVMRLQWNMTAGSYKTCVADYQILEQRDTSAWPRTLKLYYATLKVAFLSYFYDETGGLEKTKTALTELHHFFDEDAEKQGAAVSREDGSFEVPISGDGRISIQAMPIPHISALLYVLSAAFSNDPTSSRPARFKFLDSGLQTIEDARAKGFTVASTSSPAFVQQDRTWLRRLEADALILRAEMELTRSAFKACSETLRSCLTLITRDTPSLWDEYKVPYTLLQGMLYHAVDQPDKALKCYTAVLVMQPNHPLALASISMIRLGRGELTKITQTPKKPEKSAASSVIGQEIQWLQMPIEKLISETRGRCEAAIVPRLKLASSIIIGATRSGIVKSKHNLSGALTTANNVGLAQVKPLILLLLSNLYSNTRKAAAKEMLQSAFKLSVGMGSQRIKNKDKALELSETQRREMSVGNARTGLRAGRELLRVYVAQGEQEKAQKQKLLNEAHEMVLKRREGDWRPDVSARRQAVASFAF